MAGPGDLNGSTPAEILEEAISGRLAQTAGATQVKVVPTASHPNVTHWDTYVRPAVLTLRPYVKS